jgi:hypothetical protein
MSPWVAQQLAKQHFMLLQQHKQADVQQSQVTLAHNTCYMCILSAATTNTCQSAPHVVASALRFAFAVIKIRNGQQAPVCGMSHRQRATE